MESLPIEVLSQILKFLNLADRREFALVSKKLYEATLDPALYKNSAYVLDAHSLLTTNEGDEEAAVFSCKSPNLYINGLDENLTAKSLLCPEDGRSTILGRHVIRLSLKRCSILEKSFVEILGLCEALESLDVTSCNALFMMGPVLTQPERYQIAEKVLANTTSLCISSTRYLTDASLKTFINLCPKLTSLSLVSCNMLFSEFGHTQPSSLTFDTFYQMVSLRAFTLTEINLSRTALRSEALRELSSINGLNLRKVIFQNCRDLGDSGVVALAKKQPGLRVVDVRGCSDIGNPSVSALCCCALNLTELYLAKCQKINDTSACKICTLSKLRILDISECYNVTIKSVSDILNSLSNLHTFHANGCNLHAFESTVGITERVFSKLGAVGQEVTKIDVRGLLNNPTSHFTNLTELSINSGKYVNDLTIQCIFVNLTGLRCLSLGWCHYITDQGLLGLEVDASKQTYSQNMEAAEAYILSTGRFSNNHGRAGFLSSPGSEFNTCVNWDEQDVKSSMQARGITRLRALERLSLSNCPKITDESFIRIFCVGSSFQNMQRLDLNLMQQAVTDDVLVGVALGCPLLTRLSISCSSVTDRGVEFITSKLHRLEVLDFSNCDNITTGFFVNLAKHNRWLHELDVSSCKQIPASSEDELMKILPLLSRIHTRYSGATI